MFFYLDIYYIIIVVPFILVAALASLWVKSAFSRYSRQPISRGLTGAEAARRVLLANGVTGVQIARCAGKLTDHYDPRDHTIYLSDDVYGSATAAACGVAAHEAGHAVQHAEEYLPIRIRTALVPVANFGSSIGMWLIMIGILLCFLAEIFVYVAYAGILLFSLTALFQLVTLPVEFNASRRAMTALCEGGVLTEEEQMGARRVLTAAAMTYVAALGVTLAQILRLLLIVASASGRRRD